MTTNDPDEKGTSYGEWLSEVIKRKKLTVNVLSDKSGVSGPAIYNIINGNSLNPQRATREKLEAALKEKPEKTLIDNINDETNVTGLGNLEEFYPHDTKEAPEKKGIYVLYDAFDRPVYIGKAVKQTIRTRVDQHREKFWFRDPIVKNAKYIEIVDAPLCGKIEMLLIRFLGSHNLLNKKGADAFKSKNQDEDT